MTRQIVRHTWDTSCRVWHDTTKLIFNFGFVTPILSFVYFLYKICTFAIRRLVITLTLACTVCFLSCDGFVALHLAQKNYMGTPWEEKNEVNVTWGMTKSDFYNFCETWRDNFKILKKALGRVTCDVTRRYGWKSSHAPPCQCFFSQLSQKSQKTVSLFK